MVQESIKHFPIPLRKSLKVIAEGDFLDPENLSAFVPACRQAGKTTPHAVGLDECEAKLAG
jgi:hypothetical protein